MEIPGGKPKKRQLTELAKRCRDAHSRLKAPDSEVRLPLFVEFSGSPKSGKTTIIGIVAHFLRRMKMNVVQPAEGASLRTPGALRDDLLSFNTWSACYALQEILQDCSSDPPCDLVMLDRGLFDVAGWMEFLCSFQKRITEDDVERITRFVSMDLWCRRINAVFLFTANDETSLERETADKLSERPGSVMNPEILKALRGSYERAAERCAREFPCLYHVDTSKVGAQGPYFQQIAFVVASKIVELLEALTTQMLLVTKSVKFEGFCDKRSDVEETIRAILNDGKPVFVRREAAEKKEDIQQVVPYAFLENDRGQYFWARRKADVRRKQLQKKFSKRSAIYTWGGLAV